MARSIFRIIWYSYSQAEASLVHKDAVIPFPWQPSNYKLYRGHGRKREDAGAQTDPLARDQLLTIPKMKLTDRGGGKQRAGGRGRLDRS